MKQRAEKSDIPAAARRLLSEWGRRGGLKGKKSDKVRAGQAGNAAMKAKIEQAALQRAGVVVPAAPTAPKPEGTR